MKAPKEIIAKAKEYVALKKKTKALYEDIEKWINQAGGDDVYISNIFISDSPCGDAQGDGEYCLQSSVGESGDSFEGVYYHQSKENPNIYLAYDYWC